MNQTLSRPLRALCRAAARRRPRRAAALPLTALLLLASLSAHADPFGFHFLLDTSHLPAPTQGSYYSLYYSLIGTSGANQVNITNILFGGGSPQGSPSYVGTATGTLGSAVHLDDLTNFDNEFTQAFANGNTLSFDVNLPNVTVDPSQPDNFTIGLLDGDPSTNPTTNGPYGFELASVDLASTHPTLGDVNAYGYTVGGTTYTANISPLSPAGAAPEPAFYQMSALLGCGAIAMALSRRRKSKPVGEPA